GVALDHMAAGKRIIQSRFKAALPRDRHRFPAEPRIGGPPAAVAEHDWRNPRRRGRHRMTVEQQRATEAVKQKLQLRLDRGMVGAMRTGDAVLELSQADRPAP